MSDQEYYEDDGYDEPQSRLPGWLTETPYWAISAVLHLIVILVIGGIVISREVAKQQQKKVVVKREFKPKEYDPTKKRAMKRRPKILDDIKKKPILKLKPDVVTPSKPKGTDMNNMTNKNLMRDSVNDSFGTGGGFAGAYGNRSGKGSLTREGGSEGTEQAVLAALKWLERHQHPDGHWSSKEFFKGNCKDANIYDGDIQGFDGFDVGVTGLAMLAYLGFGHTHKDGEFKEFRIVMRKAMNWMLKQQSRDASDPSKNGVFGHTDKEEWIYNHSIATMAMAELLFISRDKFKLARSVQDATKYCMKSQNDNFGWKYEYKGGLNDTSVTGWMVLALKTAKACSDMRLLKEIQPEEYKPHFEWAINWFDRSTSKLTGITGYEAPGDEGSRLQKIHPDPYPFSKRLSCMSAVAVLCRLFAGESRKSDAIKNGVGILMKEPPRWAERRDKRLSTINIYYWYYGSYAMFQFGGPKWREWNDAMQEALLPSQVMGTDKDGSWDPIGEWGAAGGRVYSTAIGAMTLEVYYRFERQEGG